jgi:hypothetical protein
MGEKLNKSYETLSNINFSRTAAVSLPRFFFSQISHHITELTSVMATVNININLFKTFPIYQMSFSFLDELILSSPYVTYFFTRFL